MHENAAHRARIISSVAATVISLACGTNYVYSAWAPQFADRLHLSATQSNLIGLAGNLGMYSLGVPIGMFVDTKGPRPAVIAGSLLLGLGYYPLRQGFVDASGPVSFFCFVSFLTGLGGCMAFSAAVKTSALNWPHHRGTATAFPLAAFGLSAFFFSAFGSLLTPGDTSDFLLLLSVGTFLLTFGGFFFLRVLPHPHYHALVDESNDLSDSQQLRRTLSEEAKITRVANSTRNGGRGHYQSTDEPGRSPTYPPTGRLPGDGIDYDADADAATESAGVCRSRSVTESSGSSADAVRKQVATDEVTYIGTDDAESLSPSLPLPPQPLVGSHPSWGPGSSASSSAPHASLLSGAASALADADPDLTDETSSLMSKSSSLPGEVLVQNSVDLDQSHRIDIRGWKLLRNTEFWQLFSIMGILAGIGLMTINNIGHDALALWKHYDKSVDDSLLVARQQMHVSILSVGSFSGRLLSGVGSDFLVKRLHASRIWCLVFAAAIFVAAQLCAINITNPHYLGFVSALSGLGYGFLFGVFPSIVAEAFGIHGLSQNWGFMTLSPVLSSNIFNLFYGAVFDRHTVVDENGERSCTEGLACYQAAYYVTLAACGLGLAVTLLVIRHQRQQREKEAGKRSLED